MGKAPPPSRVGDERRRNEAEKEDRTEQKEGRTEMKQTRKKENDNLFLTVRERLSTRTWLTRSPP